MGFVVLHMEKAHGNRQLKEGGKCVQGRKDGTGIEKIEKKNQEWER